MKIVETLISLETEIERMFIAKRSVSGLILKKPLSTNIQTFMNGELLEMAKSI
jgi:hypothetical protein